MTAANHSGKKEGNTGQGNLEDKKILRLQHPSNVKRCLDDRMWHITSSSWGCGLKPVSARQSCPWLQRLSQALQSALWPF